MSTLANFIFSDTDILESRLTPENRNTLIAYRTSTITEGVFRAIPNTTKVESLGSRQSANWIPQSSIDWKHHEFQIGTIKRKWRDVNHKPGLFSSNLEWQWSNVTYAVKYKQHRWTAARTDSQDTIVAELIPHETHLFSNDIDPAILSISPNLASEDLAFLLLVMLYSECMRLEDKKGYYRRHEGKIHYLVSNVFRS